MPQELRIPQRNVNAISSISAVCDNRNNDRMDLIDWIKQGLRKDGKTQAGLAKAMAVNPSSVSRLLKRERRLQADEVRVVAHYLGEDPPAGIMPADRPTESTVKAQNIRSDDVDTTKIVTEGLVGERDFPVFASAMGGDGEMIVAYEPIEYVKRPSILEGVPGAFAMYVVGESMEPRYEPGDMLLVHPKRQPIAGDDILIVKHDGETREHAASVKRLVKAHPDRYRVKQYNPPSEFEVPRPDIKNVFVIVGSYGKRR